MKGLAVGEVKKGKVEEFMSRLATHYQEFALEIEGFKHQIETFFDLA